MFYKMLRKKNCIFLFIIAIVMFGFELFYPMHNRKVSPLLEALKDFSLIANNMKISVMVIDEELLKLAVEEEARRANFENTINNKGINFVSLGTTASLLQNKSVVLRAFRGLFDVRIIPSVKYSIQMGGSFRPNSSHYLFFHKDFKVTFHCVVFHAYQGYFLYHGQIDTSSVEANVLKKLVYGLKHPGVYHRKNLRTRFFVTESLVLNIPSSVTQFLRARKESTFIPCNASRVKAFRESFDLKYNESEQQKFRLFRHKAYHLLISLNDALHTEGLPFWISSGTCLGWFRQCDLIPYTKDVDIGVWAADYYDDIIQVLESNGFEIIQMFGKLFDSYEISFLFQRLKLDMFFFYEAQNYTWNGGTQSKTGKKFKYIFKKFSLCWTSFLDTLVRVPCDAERYVRDNYGDDWFRPISEWDWKRSPSNVVENGQWPKEERDQVIQIF